MSNANLFLPLSNLTDAQRLILHNPELIGQPIDSPLLGLDGHTHTRINEAGTFGRSANGVAPLLSGDGRVIGEIGFVGPPHRGARRPRPRPPRPRGRRPRRASRSSASTASPTRFPTRRSSRP